ncbi:MULTISPECIES: fimbrial protein [Serratia]|jgi:type 1 fimbria pilin|uniref:Fimbrial protein n=1 Tax=Serratia fonticola TaxID=47917 RepID=A0AAE7EMB8_SERFO|nr:MULTISPECIES: fimbrial protein [Serratia]MDQ7211907.1 fimbrial protein [Serratia fonticola]QKJ61538.2 fimbrial protein [Serratia fonticola]
MRSVAGMSLLLSFALLAISPSQAAENMSFSGTLIEPPPCLVNNDKDIDVPFDRIGVKSVDGVKHRRQVDYVLDCTAGPAWSMVLTLLGPVAAFEPATLQTNIANLGIKIYQNGEPFELGTPIAVDPLNPPLLEAVPVKKPGTELTEGTFEVTATLLADYQ